MTEADPQPALFDYHTPPRKENHMDTAPQTKARQIVRDYHNEKYSAQTESGENGGLLDLDDVYVVWFSKTLQNWKALVATELADSRYYEVTYNGDKAEAYLDAYQKIENVVVPG